MTQPLDRNCDLPALGDLDTETGEFWTGRSKDMTRNRENTSAFERNRLFLNKGKPEFVDASFASGCAIDSDSRSVIAADFNRDGKSDLLVASVGGGPLRLFLNETQTSNHSVTVRLFGTAANSNGIGSRVTITCAGRDIVRDIFPANGCLGIGPCERTIGVGGAEQIEKLVVRWASGREQVFSRLPVDGILSIKEGRPSPRFAHFSTFRR